MNRSSTQHNVRQEIARRAYLRFCARGSTPGGDLDDWLAAEREVLDSVEREVLDSAAHESASAESGNASRRRSRKGGR